MHLLIHRSVLYVHKIFRMDGLSPRKTLQAALSQFRRQMVRMVIRVTQWLIGVQGSCCLGISDVYST